MKTSNQRLYYLDWLRVLAFGLLFLFHAWRPFDHLEWHVKNTEQHFVFDILTMFTHGWRMHLIFLVSGAGTWLAMRSRKGQFMTDRLKRLIVPFLFGIVVLIPPQRYYEWIMFRDFQGGYIEFLINYSTQQLDTNMGPSLLLWFGHLGTHLWYLPYLFVMTLVSTPLFRRIREGRIRLNWLKRTMSTHFGIFILVIPMLVCRVLLKPAFPHYTDWADFFVYLWPFLYGFIFIADREFIVIIKNKTTLLLNVGILSSLVFMYIGSTNDQMVQSYMNPTYDLDHFSSSIMATFIALSWTMYFLGLFAKCMDFNHSILIPANISILPIYMLHQTLIIVFGYYIIGTDLSILLKFIAIAATAIPASILIYRLVQTNNPMRFLFGLKPRRQKQHVGQPVLSVQPVTRRSL